MSDIGRVVNSMITFYSGDVKRINHFLKVYGFAKAIGEMEKLDENIQEILEIAAITHDIGIKNSEIKHNCPIGKYQEIEGPPEARKLLTELGIEVSIIERVCYLIAHHHTYRKIRGIDYQILVEADFLVNAYEDNLSKSAIQSFKEKVFRTESGATILHNLYGQ